MIIRMAGGLPTDGKAELRMTADWISHGWQSRTMDEYVAACGFEPNTVKVGSRKLDQSKHGCEMESTDTVIARENTPCMRQRSIQTERRSGRND
jgi:hypothetical protein